MPSSVMEKLLYEFVFNFSEFFSNIEYLMQLVNWVSKRLLRSLWRKKISIRMIVLFWILVQLVSSHGLERGAPSTRRKLQWTTQWWVMFSFTTQCFPCLINRTFNANLTKTISFSKWSGNKVTVDYNRFHFVSLFLSFSFEWYWTRTNFFKPDSIKEV